MKKNKSLDIIIILSKLNKKRKTLSRSLIVSIILSTLYSLILSDVYKSTSTFYPHYDNELNTNNLKNIAGLAGINLRNENSDNIPPNLYPKLISSTSFKFKILNEFIDYNDMKMTYREYLYFYDKSNFIFNILNKNYFTKNKVDSTSNKQLNYNLTYVNDIDNYLFSLLKDKISINVNEKDGFIELSVFDNNPEVSSQIAIKSNEILQKSIIDFKLKNIKDIYNFTSEQLSISKNRLFKLQDSLAEFRDSNISIKSDLFLNRLNRLETEFNIARNIYNELAITKEKTAIDVRKNTPIFTNINQVVVPNEKDSPNRILFITVITFFTFFITSLWIIIKNDIIQTLKKIKSN